MGAHAGHLTCHGDAPLTMDHSTYLQINQFAERTSWLHGPAKAYGQYGIVAFALLLLVGWWRARRSGDLAADAGVAWAGGAALVALAIGQVVGGLVNRARPYEAVPAAHVLLSRTTDFSFPSDHATAVGAVAVGLWLVDRPLGRVAAALALLMAATRVYAGVHYPSDVLAGLLLGGLVAFGGAKPATRLGESLLRRMARFRAGVLLTGATAAEAIRP